jgi:hypothetical protein
MEIVPTPTFTKNDMKKEAVVSVPKEQDTSDRAFQWMLFRPQAHAVEPFKTQTQTRLTNTTNK